MNLDRTFFVTTVTWQRTPLFRNPQTAELMMDVLTNYREQKKYDLHEFVIMPDHLHLLITPAADISAPCNSSKAGSRSGLGKHSED